MPTYNRPSGLRRALESLARQTALPEEIIVSDNASPGDETKSVIDEFAQRLPMLRYVRQPANIGAFENFLWLLDRATSPYFMWLADDDEYGSENVLEALYGRFAGEPQLRLVFPEVDAYYDHDRAQWSRGIHGKVFGRCSSDFDYLLAFVGHGGGHCFYGLYDRAYLKALGPRTLLDTDLAYFGEGRFLHQMFLNGGARFEPKARFTYNATAARKIDNLTLLTAFSEYSSRIWRLYRTSGLSACRKLRVLKMIAQSHLPYRLHLWRNRKFKG